MGDINRTGRRKTSVSVDERLLARAGEILGTRTVKATIEHALLDVLRHRARAEEIAALGSMSDLDLDRPSVMKRAWRH